MLAYKTKLWAEDWSLQEKFLKWDMASYQFYSFSQHLLEN